MITAYQGCPGQGMTLCPPPATKRAASAVAAPAAPVLGAGTRNNVLIQSGAGTVHMFLAGFTAQVVKP